MMERIYWGGGIDAIKKNTEAILGASHEVSLKENTKEKN
jgi:hypothetical protein